MGLFGKIFKSDNERQIRKIDIIAQKVEALADTFASKTDKELQSCTRDFKERLNKGETLDQILPEAFACVREASTRVLGMRHFHVQIIGGIALHQGRIAEMCTGEGKTLVATMPAYLNALTGRGVHIVTVNDYLANLHADWMGQLFRFLGLTVGVICNQQDFDDKKRAYNCDITYGTNSAFGFDYLRDNQVRLPSQMVQRELNYVIIDEVDSVLIDEARTPLIISGKPKKTSDLFYLANSFARTLKEPNPEAENEEDKIGDFEINEEDKKIILTERGTSKAEAHFKVDNIGDYENLELYRNIRLAIRANFLMKKDKDYVVKDNQVIIVDEFTGRLQIGRRFNDGLHTAIEAKENIKVKDENQVVATITYQNLFRLYKKLSGMTGTAKTEEEEFKNIYGLDIVVIPTNRPIARIDENDKIYTTHQGKLRAVVEDIRDCYKRGQPVLVGTVSVEKSEELSNLLYRERIPHNVLNAKNHEKEAEIVAQAGRKGQVTIATNMAGRGTDIKLGGNPEFLAKQMLKRAKYSDRLIAEATEQYRDVSKEALQVRDLYLQEIARLKAEMDKEKEEVLALGGLRIIGTERHESRRIDNQLRGRSGRQGDKGSSVFYISMEDDLVRIFGGDRLKSMAQSLHLPDDVPISMTMISKKIEDAQKSIEFRNYSIRKNVLSYDDVMNRQRTLIYTDRRKMLYDKTFYQENFEILHDTVTALISGFDFSVDYRKINFDDFNRAILGELLQREEFIDYEYTKLIDEDDFQGFDKEKLASAISSRATRTYKKIVDDYLDLLEKDSFEDAVDLAVDFSKPYADFDYKKLNSIIFNNLPKSLNFDSAFTISDAERLNNENKLQKEYIVEFIKDKLCKILSEKLAKIDEQIISSYIKFAIKKAFADGKKSALELTEEINKYLKADLKVVLSSSDLTPSEEGTEKAVKSLYKLHEDESCHKFSLELLDNILEVYKNKLSSIAYEWDFKNVDKDFSQCLFAKGNNGVVIAENFITKEFVNSLVIKHLAKVATTRLESIYSEQYGENAEEILSRVKGKFKTLYDYVLALVSSKSELAVSCDKWDYRRFCDVLSFNCLQKNTENLQSTLLGEDDLKTFDTSIIFSTLKENVVSTYTKIINGLRSLLSVELIKRLVSLYENESSKKNTASTPSQICTAYNDFLRTSLLANNLFDKNIVLISESDLEKSEIEKVQLVYENLDKAISNKIKDFNFHILQGYLGLILQNSVNTVDAISKLDELLSLNCKDELLKINADGARPGQTLSIITAELNEKDGERRKALCEKAHEDANKLLSGETVTGIEDGKTLLENVSLDVCLENAINRVIIAYRSHKDEKYLLDEKSQEEIYVLIESVVKDCLNLQKEEYVNWNITEINNALAYALLPSNTPIELVRTFFTKADISGIVREKIADKLYEELKPVFEQIIEKNKEKGYKSAHDHILKMLPEVVAGIVAENVDFGIDIDDWDYETINANLRERILPITDFDEEDFVLVDRKLAGSMNIDTVIDAVIEKVIQAYEKRAVRYNLEHIREYIEDDVKTLVEKREHIENWNYKILNRHFGRVYLAAVDREKKILDEEYLEKYLEEGKRTLTHPQIVNAIIDRLTEIYVERIDVYNRFIWNLCHRRAKNVLTYGDFERFNLLKYTDSHWFDHIDNMERLRVGIGLRALGQQNPITCYQSEGFSLFDEMIGLIHEDVVIHTLKDDPESLFEKDEKSVSERFGKNKNKKTVFYKRVGAQPIKRSSPKIGPNDPCPCGSGKKYKKCCMNKKQVMGWNSISNDD